LTNLPQKILSKLKKFWLKVQKRYTTETVLAQTVLVSVWKTTNSPTEIHLNQYIRFSTFFGAQVGAIGKFPS